MEADHPSVFTHQSALSFQRQITVPELTKRVESLLLKLAKELAGANGEIIGHIKSLLGHNAGDKDSLCGQSLLTRFSNFPKQA